MKRLKQKKDGGDLGELAKMFFPNGAFKPVQSFCGTSRNKSVAANLCNDCCDDGGGDCCTDCVCPSGNYEDKHIV